VRPVMVSSSEALANIFLFLFPVTVIGVQSFFPYGSTIYYVAFTAGDFPVARSLESHETTSLPSLELGESTFLASFPSPGASRVLETVSEVSGAGFTNPVATTFVF